MNPLIGLKRTAPRLLIILALLCFGLLPGVQAVIPPPDGGYPNFTTAEGTKALFSLTTGAANTAVGWFSLFGTSSGSFNTAVGAGALDLNTADDNTAVGAAALLLNTTGTENTANGRAALEFNDTGSDNTAVGALALFNNTIGSSNTANGVQALFVNTTGIGNTAIGLEALFHNTTGSNNTAIGSYALGNNTSGSGNIALGVNAGVGVAGASNVIAIGTTGADVADSCFIGNISGVNEGGTISAVYINSNHQLGTQAPPSARRFKKEIKSMDKASEAVLGLKPVTFHYKSDNAATPQFGLIAEEVAEVNPDLIVRDKNGEIYTVCYDAVNAMLLNEFLKEHKKVEKQEATITRLTNDFQTVSRQQRNEIQLLSAQLKEQAAQIQKVSAQLEAGKPEPQVVNNNQ